MQLAIPYFVAAGITGAIMVTLSFFIPDPVQARSTLCCGLIVAIVIATIPIYSVDSWPLAKRTLVHFVIMLATVFPILLYSQWFRLPVAIGVFLLFGIVGWTIGYLVTGGTRS